MIGWTVAAAAAAVAAGLWFLRRRDERDRRRLAEVSSALAAREAELTRERDLLAAAMAAVPEGFLILDAQHRIERSNPAAERLLTKAAV